MVPREPGQFELEPAFSWFDPDSAAYVSYVNTPYTVNISQGSQRNRPSVLDREEASAPADIRFIKNAVDFLQTF